VCCKPRIDPRQRIQGPVARALGMKPTGIAAV
jgi:hypothetical protein